MSSSSSSRCHLLPHRLLLLLLPLLLPLLLLLLLLLGSFALASRPSPLLVVDELRRTIDPAHAGSLVSYDFAAVRFTNPSDASDPVSVFTIALPPSRAARLSFLIARPLDPSPAAVAAARLSNFASLRRQLDFLETSSNAAASPDDTTATDDDTSRRGGSIKVNIYLDRALAPGESGAIQILAAFDNTIRVLPTEIPQESPQYVVFEDSLGYGLPYEVKSYTCQIHTGRGRTISFSPTKLDNHGIKARVEDNYIVYGPFTHDPIEEHVSVHFENNEAGIRVLSWRREVWVRSLDKTLEFDEWIHVAHQGAKILGNFNRFAMMMNERRTAGTNSKRELRFSVPALARDLFLRDDIGNVSTSAIVDESGSLDSGEKIDRKSFVIMPRFPLYGGWEYNWNHGYEVDASATYLSRGDRISRDNDELATDGPAPYVLTVPLIDGVRRMAVDYIELRIVLPEAAEVSKVEFVGSGRTKELFASAAAGASRSQTEERALAPTQAPGEPVASGEYEMSRTYYYLDTVGRPTVVVRTTKFIARAPYAAAPAIRVTYVLSTRSYVLKPLLLGSVSLTLVAGLLTWLLRGPSKMEKAAHARGLRFAAAAKM